MFVQADTADRSVNGNRFGRAALGPEARQGAPRGHLSLPTIARTREHSDAAACVRLCCPVHKAKAWSCKIRGFIPISATDSGGLVQFCISVYPWVTRHILCHWQPPVTRPSSTNQSRTSVDKLDGLGWKTLVKGIYKS